MLCRKCGGDKFRTVDVKRNRKWVEAIHKWVYSDNVDARMVMCRSCHATFWTETHVVLGHRFSPSKLASVPVLIEQLEMFEGEKP